jgi:hypothetical protein
MTFENRLPCILLKCTFEKAKDHIYMDCIHILIKYIIIPSIKLACNVLLTTVRTYELCFKKQACKDADDKLTLD